MTTVNFLEAGGETLGIQVAGKPVILQTTHDARPALSISQG